MPKMTIEIVTSDDFTVADLHNYVDHLAESFLNDSTATGLPAWEIRVKENN